MTEAEARLILDVRISRFDHAQDVNEALEIAKQALEEIQQYREIGTVDDFQRLDYLKSRYEDETYDYCGEYGTSECGLKDRVKKIAEYEAIGTVEECRVAVEKVRIKIYKPKCEDCLFLEDRELGKKGAVTGICSLKPQNGRRYGKSVACRLFERYCGRLE